jgi:geranylgeranyl diphosphate synthase, type II
MSHFDLKKYLRSRQALINQSLARKVPPADHPAPTLFEAMNYSLCAGGKRLRPVLVLASWEACTQKDGDYPELVIASACALEMIHTYSLIHDDLPAMDDDDLRRGKATNHKIYGEAMAILAGDSLLTEAFDQISQTHSDDPQTVLRVVALIARASGARGMAGGQVLDLQAEGRKLTREDLEKLHCYKTGCLIHASCVVGAELSKATKEQKDALDAYGKNIGLAFQIADDVLDVEGGTDALGKTAGADAAHDKPTYASILGVDASKKKAKALIESAITNLEVFEDSAEPLRQIARYIVERKS